MISSRSVGLHGECLMIFSRLALRRALVVGSCASITSTIALAVAAKAEGHSAVQPLNATSHWWNGDRAASFSRIDGAHTLLGYATNHAACIFWAIFFEAWRARRPSVGALPMLQEALVMSTIAAAVDYGPTPKRFTPGWELVLSKKGMAVAYFGLAIGLAAGSLLNQSHRDREV